MAKFISLLTAILLSGGGIAFASGIEATNEVPQWMTRLCKSEDSVNCQWNAKTEGNGKGWSYYVREFPGKAHMTCVMYIDHPKYDYCIKNK